jgi:thiol-disulfide isomerase/thioredoxin
MKPGATNTNKPSALVLGDGLIAFVKRECPTCELVAPVLADIAASNNLIVFSQDDPTFPETISSVRDDSQLESSFHLDVEIVPTLIRISNGKEVDRTLGWNRDEWQHMTGIDNLGSGLPINQPGCGSLSTGPGIAEELLIRFGKTNFVARSIPLPEYDDDVEACYERGWSDGLPVTPPTPVRVMRMLAGTTRDPQEIIGLVPPKLAPCTVEKIAINAVMAGCRPEYLPVVLAAIEAALIDDFAMHGVLCTTSFAGPMVIVNGPVCQAIGLNSGMNVLGQGTRANSTIGRALQLIIRNIGGGIPGEIDRAMHGNPAKVGLCFAENEEQSCWESLSVERGFAPAVSTVSLWAGEGTQGVSDDLSRDPESLCRSWAASLMTIGHIRRTGRNDVLIVVSPENQRVFCDAGWDKTKLRERLFTLTTRQGRDIISGLDGMAPGIPPGRGAEMIPKFRAEGIHFVHAGGPAGMVSTIIPSWSATGIRGTNLVTVPIKN